jgi:hypothetical protein
LAIVFALLIREDRVEKGVGVRRDKPAWSRG